MTNKLLSSIGICKKAGRLALGFNAACEAAASGKAALLVTASDISQKSRKETAFIAQKYNVEHIAAQITMDELSIWLKFRVGILAVTDRELAKAVKTAACRENEEELLI